VESSVAENIVSEKFLIVAISKDNSRIECYVSNISIAATEARDNYGQGETSVSFVCTKGDRYRITGAQTIHGVRMM
jgi:hypothetical protein